jgi:hypothetical protein
MWKTGNISVCKKTPVTTFQLGIYAALKYLYNPLTKASISPYFIA